MADESRERAATGMELDEGRASASAAARISDGEGDGPAWTSLGTSEKGANERALFDLRAVHLFPHSLHPLYQGEKKKSRKKKK